MKASLRFFGALISTAAFLLISLSLSGCGEDKVTNSNGDDGPKDYGLVRVDQAVGYYMGWDGIQDNEVPVHTVSVDEIYIGKYEVTYSLWDEVKSWATSNGYTFANPGQAGGCIEQPCANSWDHPVTKISWRDCIAWCNAYSEKEGLDPIYYTSAEKTEVYRNAVMGGDIGNDFVDWTGDGFRLPTEAEWEHAARYIDFNSISSGAHHSGYNIDPDIEDCAWYEDNATSGTRAVGQLQENSLGAYDMSGNVWEWCWDKFGPYPETFQDNPHGPEVNVSDPNIYRVHRGGGWYNSESYCRTATRDFGGRNSTSTEIYTGFRIVRANVAD